MRPVSVKRESILKVNYSQPAAPLVVYTEAAYV